MPHNLGLQDKTAEQAAYYNRDPNLVEVSPGITPEQEKAKAAREQVHRPQDMVPPAVIK